MGKVVIIMGSGVDLEHCRKISATLKKFGIEYVLRVASAHKTPLKVLEIIEEYKRENVVFIAVAGRSNALGGLIDAQTQKPVITCPPYSDKFAGADIFSSIRIPSGVCPMLVLEPEEAALAAAKILALSDSILEEKIKSYQEKQKEKIYTEDKKTKNYPEER